MTDSTAEAATIQTAASATVAVTPTPAVSTAPAAPAAPAATGSLLGSGESATQQAASDTATADAAKTADAADASATKTEGTIGAPEAYTLTAPEGTALDASVVTKFSEVAKALDLSQTAAQKIVESLAPTIAAANAERIATYRADLVAQVKADKDLGGDKLDENLAVANRGLKAYGSPALRTLLNTSGLGDHPEVLRLLFKVGQSISEDGKVFTGGSQPTNAEKTAAQRMYGK